MINHATSYQKEESESLLIALLKRVENESAEIDSVFCTSDALANRLLGSEPKDSPKGDKLAPVPSGIIGQLNEALDLLADRRLRLSYAVGRLSTIG